MAEHKAGGKHGDDDESDIEDDILTRFKGLPNIVEGVENIYEHLVQRHIKFYPPDATHLKYINPQVIILFESGDISEVIQAAVNDLTHPIGTGLVTSILVQEPVSQKLIRKIRGRMPLMDERIVEHPNFLNTLKMIERMGCRTLYIEEFHPLDKEKLYGRMNPNSPIIVLDFPQIYFGDKPSAVITINTFRTLNEAVKLCYREGLDFETVSIWTDKLTQCYDLLYGLSKFSNFQFNCINVPFKALGFVTVNNDFHYEVLPVNGELKSIVFPLNESDDVP